MLYKFLCVLCVSILFVSVAQGEDATSEAEIVSPTVNYADTIGIGTEGYGSPIQSDRVRSGEIYSERSGYVHTFLSVGGFYTDNLFNDDTDEKSDLFLVHPTLTNENMAQTCDAVRSVFPPEPLSGVEV